MKWNIVTPPVWYCAFWLGMLCGLYVVIKYAIIGAALWLKTRGYW